MLKEPQEKQNPAPKENGLPAMSTVTRIAIVGRSGSGKSTLACALGVRLGLPVTHLDKFFWLPGWVERPRHEFESRHDAIVYENKWIIDGNNARTMPGRFGKAQLIVFFDYPLRVCLRRILGRMLRYRGRDLPHLTQGCPEHFDIHYLKYVWNFDRITRPKIVAAIEKSGTPCIRLQTPDDTQDFLDSIASRKPQSGTE